MADETPEGPAIRSYWDAALRLIRPTWREFLLYDLIFSALAVAVLGPLGNWVFGRLIATSGRLSLSNEQILSFFLSPLGIITIVVSGAVVLSILYLQQGGFMIIGSGALRGQRVAAARGLWLTVRRMPALLGLSGLQSGIYLLFFAPFAALLGLTYSLLLSDYDISYLLAETPPVFWVALTIAGALTLSLLLLYAYLYVRWTFALPACLFEGKRFRCHY